MGSRAVRSLAAGHWHTLGAVHAHAGAGADHPG
jgi:hypothetical protein